MNDTLTMQEVYDLTAELLEVYRKAHNAWCVRRAASHGPLGMAERCASHVCLRVMLRALPIAALLNDESIEKLHELADAIEITTSSNVSDATPGKQGLLQ